MVKLMFLVGETLIEDLRFLDFLPDAATSCRDLHDKIWDVVDDAVLRDEEDVVVARDELVDAFDDNLPVLRDRDRTDQLELKRM